MATQSTLPALQVQQQQQPDLLSKYSQLMALKNSQQQQQMMQQEAPLRLQQLQQGVQSGGLQLQQQQQALKNKQAITEAYQKWDGKNYEDLAHLALQSGATGDAVQALQQHGLSLRKTASDIAAQDATTGSKNVETTIKKNDLVVGSLSSILQAPDDQIPSLITSTAQELAQKGLIDPQHLQMADQIARSGDPEKMRQALDIFRKSYMANSQLLDESLKTAQTRNANATAAKAETDAQRGGSTDVDKFESDYLKSNNLPDTPQNRIKAFQEYTRETKIQPAQVRVEGYGQTRMMPVIDTANNNALTYVNANDINTANRVTPGRYAPAAQGGKDLQKSALIEDIRGNINQVRTSLNDKTLPEFTGGQRAAIATALGNEDSQGALSAAFRGGVLGSLNPAQQEYLINMAQLKENAMAMRSVLGAGQGSEDLRAAILATLPGPRTPSKAYAKMQLDKFENVLDRLSRGIPTVPLKGSAPSGHGAIAVGSVITQNGHQYKVTAIDKDGKPSAAEPLP